MNAEQLDGPRPHALPRYRFSHVAEVSSACLAGGVAGVRRPGAVERDYRVAQVGTSARADNPVCRGGSSYIRTAAGRGARHFTLAVPGSPADNKPHVRTYDPSDAPGTIVADLFGLANVPELKPRYNIAPTQPVLTVSENAGQRVAGNMRLGVDTQLVRWPEARQSAHQRPRRDRG